MTTLLQQRVYATHPERWSPLSGVLRRRRGCCQVRAHTPLDFGDPLATESLPTGDSPGCDPLPAQDDGGDREACRSHCVLNYSELA